MKNIMIWSDFACPFCYIGEKRLKDAIKELGVEDEIEITYRAFELDPNAPVKAEEGNIVERMARKYGLTPEEAKKRVEDIDRLGKDVGIDMKFSSVKPSNTFDAHRLMKFAEAEYEKPVVEALNESLFKAYFTDNKVLSDRNLLLKLAEEATIDATQANEVIRSEKMYADQVRFDEREAAERGVRGVPFIVFDGKFAVPGAVSTEDFKSALREMLGRKKDGHEGLKGASCDENGCAV